MSPGKVQETDIDGRERKHRHTLIPISEPTSN